PGDGELRDGWLAAGPGTDYLRAHPSLLYWERHCGYLFRTASSRHILFDAGAVGCAPALPSCLPRLSAPELFSQDLTASYRYTCDIRDRSCLGDKHSWSADRRMADGMARDCRRYDEDQRRCQRTLVADRAAALRAARSL